MMALPLQKTNRERTITPQEFEAMPEFDELYELVNGKLVKKPMPGDDHSRIGKVIDRKIGNFDPEEKLGVLWREATFDVGTGWMPIPDLGYLVAAKVPKRSSKSVKGVPDWVVEIHSPTDLRSKVEREAATEKIRNWQAVGVRLIWAINPHKRTVEIYHPNQPQPVRTINLQDTLDGEDVVPGFQIKVSELFV